MEIFDWLHLFYQYSDCEVFFYNYDFDTINIVSFLFKNKFMTNQMFL